ncbi:hypothetical protein HPB51_021328 [Rhipicephalus microplus]|uniref:Uncharacterized protein n=1 Tax=Rhipicephalus microplus TaxID=6941 RepID=A0A9J6F844_RHIMP|nr:hypothetical protein HPB51_021328 [Rhipicephalus microplus]
MKPAGRHEPAQPVHELLPSSGKEEKKRTTSVRCFLPATVYVMGVVHQKVFAAVKQFCRQEDAVLVEKLRQLHLAGLSPDQLGVRESFCCPLPRSVVELASLDSKTTPLEKLWCLKTTLKMLSEEIYDSTAYSCARLKNPNELQELFKNGDEKATIGDFLSGLQDSIGVTYGKL